MKEGEDFDEFITHAEIDFTGSGIQVDSIIRLGCLTVLPRRTILGTIGSIARERHARLLLRLAKYLTHP
jgi:mRNA interferase MazF